MAALIMSGPMGQLPQGNTGSKAIDKHPQATVTDPCQGRSILAQRIATTDAKMHTALQGLDLMDSLQQLEGQGQPRTDQQHPGQMEVEPTLAREAYHTPTCQSTREDCTATWTWVSA